jgi:hypothetical protein
VSDQKRIDDASEEVGDMDVRKSDATLIAALVGAHEPVDRIPRLRVRLAIVLGAWSAMGVLLGFFEPGYATVVPRLVSASSYGVVVVALLLAGVAGSVAAIAASEPGREGLEGLSRRICIGGVLAALGVGLWAAASNAGVALAPKAGDALCFGTALAVGLVPGVPLFVLLRRGFVQRPLRAAGLGLLGAMGLGGLTIQLVCPLPDVTHAFFGHVLPPALAALTAAMPLALLLGADEPLEALDRND